MVFTDMLVSLLYGRKPLNIKNGIFLFVEIINKELCYILRHACYVVLSGGHNSVERRPGWIRRTEYWAQWHLLEDTLNPAVDK